MKERLDVILVNRGMADSREKAKALIMSGNVFVKGEREDKAGTFFDEKVNNDAYLFGRFITACQIKKVRTGSEVSWQEHSIVCIGRNVGEPAAPLR